MLVLGHHEGEGVRGGVYLREAPPIKPAPIIGACGQAVKTMLVPDQKILSDILSGPNPNHIKNASKAP